MNAIRDESDSQVVPITDPSDGDSLRDAGAGGNVNGEGLALHPAISVVDDTKLCTLCLTAGVDYNNHFLSLTRII